MPVLRPIPTAAFLAAVATTAHPAASAFAEARPASTPAVPSGPADAPWTVMLSIGGRLGLPPAVEAEAGVRLDDLCVHAGLARPLVDELGDAPIATFGADRLFGHRRRGFVGLSALVAIRTEDGDDEWIGAYGRIGVNAPASRHVTVRAWAELGLSQVTERCPEDDCGGDQFPLPLISFNLAVGFRG